VDVDKDAWQGVKGDADASKVTSLNNQV